MFAVFTQLADILTYRLLGLTPGDRLAESVHFFIEDTTKIFALLVIVVFVMGLFRTLLSPEKVRGMIEGKSRGAAYGLASLLGAVMGWKMTTIYVVTDMAAILGHGIMSTPGVVIDGTVVHAGGIPKPEAVRKWLEN